MNQSQDGLDDHASDYQTRLARAWRAGWAVLEILVIETIVCGIAMVPSVAVWTLAVSWSAGTPRLRLVVFALLVMPSYVLFAISLMMVSPLAARATRARTPDGAVLHLRDLEWPLLRWARYMVAIHLVRVLAGWLFRGSPLWTLYLRLNGARIGRGVYVNTLSISDHNLLTFGDSVVIGADVHVSGHTIEGGLLKTGRVVLERDVTVGLAAVIDIDVEAGAGCQIGAFSLVPKHARLQAHATYVGIPVRRLDAD